ncbi:Transcriptional regulator SlyA [Clostridiales bacterium CHKCI001]|nr:Transcriptional regulator SlyA [Clostridiales bacterium CHKCI001]
MKNIKSILLLRDLVDSYEAACKPICRSIKLSKTAFDILVFLTDNPEYDTAKDISKYRAIEPNKVSFNVERLVEEGYLERHSVPGDRRKIRLVCTEKVQAIMEQEREISEKFYSTVLEGLSDEDISRFEQYIEIICHNIEQLRHT